MKFSNFGLINSVVTTLVKSSLPIAALTTLLSATATTLIGFGFDAKGAIAQTIYPFEASYDVEEVLTPIPGTDLFNVVVLGFNPDAPYNLTNYTVRSYVRADLSTATVTFDTNPANFGLDGYPEGSLTYFGSNNDSLLGTANGVATLDFTTGLISGTSIETITGGTGRFSGATGTFNVFESEPFPEDPTASVLRGQSFSSGFFQTPQKVPEPNAIVPLLGLGLTGCTFLLQQRRRRPII